MFVNIVKKKTGYSMPKTDINTILKNGANTKIKTVDYSTPEQKAALKEMKLKSEESLNNKNINVHRLANMYITK